MRKIFRRGTTTYGESGKCLRRLSTGGFSGLSSSSPPSQHSSSSSYFLTATAGNSSELKLCAKQTFTHDHRCQDNCLETARPLEEKPLSWIVNFFPPCTCSDLHKSPFDL